MAKDTSPSCLLRCAVTALEELGEEKNNKFLVLGHFWNSEKCTSLMKTLVGPCPFGGVLGLSYRLV